MHVLVFSSAWIDLSAHLHCFVGHGRFIKGKTVNIIYNTIGSLPTCQKATSFFIGHTIPLYIPKESSGSCTEVCDRLIRISMHLVAWSCNWSGIRIYVLDNLRLFTWNSILQPKISNQNENKWMFNISWYFSLIFSSIW